MTPDQLKLQSGLHRLSQVQLALLSQGHDYLSTTHSYDVATGLFYGRLEGSSNNVRYSVSFRWDNPSPVTSQPAINDLLNRIDRQLSHHEDRRDDYDR